MMLSMMWLISSMFRFGVNVMVRFDVMSSIENISSMCCWLIVCVSVEISRFVMSVIVVVVVMVCLVMFLVMLRFLVIGVSRFVGRNLVVMSLNMLSVIVNIVF